MMQELFSLMAEKIKIKQWKIMKRNIIYIEIVFVTMLNDLFILKIKFKTLRKFEGFLRNIIVFFVFFHYFHVFISYKI